MSKAQINNPKGAFNYAFPTNKTLGSEIRVLRNVSTAFNIAVGTVVCYSTLTTDGTGVTKSTVIGNPLTAGVALTSATTVRAGGVEASSVAPAGSWLKVAVAGLAPVLVTTASSPGDILHTGNSTAFAASTAGVAQTLSTVGTTGIGARASLGRLVKASSDTNTTGGLGVVDVNVNYWFQGTTMP